MVQVWNDFASRWEELPTFASIESETLFNSVQELGLFRLGKTVGEAPQRARSLESFPNPFNAAVAIRYLVREAGPVLVTIFDLQGGRVRTLVDRTHSAGPWTTSWDGRDRRDRPAASGVYLVVVETVGGRFATKMTLVR